MKRFTEAEKAHAAELYRAGKSYRIIADAFPERGFGTVSSMLRDLRLAGIIGRRKAASVYTPAGEPRLYKAAEYLRSGLTYHEIDVKFGLRPGGFGSLMHNHKWRVDKILAEARQ